MACKCGNAQGGVLVNPSRIMVSDGKEAKPLLYTAGMSADGQCWFCLTPGTPCARLTDSQMEFVRSTWV